MNLTTMRCGSARFAALIFCCVFTSTVFPQQQPATPGAAGMEEIIVTGSRIAVPQLESVSPVTVVQSEAILKKGTTNIVDLLNTLPQVTPDQSSSLAQGSSGVANIDLRGLGPQRTLVLINGRRLMPGDPTTIGPTAADLNNIPPSLVSRIEVLTGSASATYGADAVAGVVNFIINDHFNGLQVDLNYGTWLHTNSQTAAMNARLSDIGFGPTAASGSNKTDGGKKGFNILAGGDFADNKGNVTAYFDYQQTAPVTGNARDYNACTLGATATGFSCKGSANTYPAVIAGTDGNIYQLAPDGQNFGSLYQLYNYGPDHYFQREDRRYNAGFFAHYNIRDNVEAYSEFMFMSDKTQSQYAPTAVFFSSGKALDPVLNVPDGNYLVNCGSGFGSPGANPFFNAAMYAQLCNPASPLVSSQTVSNGNAFSQLTLAVRNASGGPRRDEYDHSSYRAVFGLRGKLDEVWSYDVYASKGITDYNTLHQNDFSAARVANALQVVIDPATGKPACLANVGQNNAPGCQPYNIWQPGGITPAALAYLQVPSTQTGSTTETVVSGNVTADFGNHGLKTPWASQGVAANVGAESRRERLILSPDQANIDGDVAGSSTVLPVNGGFSVWELFGELRVPLVTDARFVHSLSADAGYRYSNYSEGFTTNTYKFGVQWAPTEDVRLRGSYQRAVRAPDIQELFRPAQVVLDGSSDFCANGNVPFFTAAQCANTGVTAAQYGHIIGNPAGQYNGQLGGNPKLTPEQATTTAFGLVFTPATFRQFTGTLDVFDIKVTNLVSTYGADFILSNCALGASPQWCNLVHRAGNGSLWLSPAGYIDDTNVNAGAVRTSGMDVGLRYQADLGAAGKLSTDLTGTYVNKWDVSPFGSTTYSCLGLFGTICGVPTPKWKHNLNLDWTTPVAGLSASLEWRYTAGVKNETTSSELSDFGPPPSTSGDAHLPSVSYFDIAAAYRWQDLTFRAGINNVLDKDPPLVGAASIGNNVFGENNTYPQIYDTLGRFVHVSVSAKF